MKVVQESDRSERLLRATLEDPRRNSQLLRFMEGPLHEGDVFFLGTNSAGRMVVRKREFIWMGDGKRHYGLFDPDADPSAEPLLVSERARDGIEGDGEDVPPRCFVCSSINVVAFEVVGPDGQWRPAVHGRRCLPCGAEFEISQEAVEHLRDMSTEERDAFKKQVRKASQSTRAGRARRRLDLDALLE